MQYVRKSLSVGVAPEYRDKLSFYERPPTDSITLDEFESFAFDRLRVLKEIDAATIRGLQRPQLVARLNEMCAKYLPLSKPEDVRKDVISHYVLRLAFCRPADRNWLLQQETALLRYRLTEGGYCTMHEFMRLTGTDYETTSVDEYESLAGVLDQTLTEGYSRSADKIFKVPFESACELVSRRAVYLRRGVAYVHERDFVSILISKYRGKLADALALAFKSLPTLKEDNGQLVPLLNALPKAGAPADFRVNYSHGKVTLATLSAVADRSFPLCMTDMRRSLKGDHKLKHWGRLQYGLFLKGIGLSLDEAIQMWRGEFTKVMSDKEFDSGYVYNVRHLYGKVGKRTDYTPYSCLKIIQGEMPTADTRHGCPFRHASGTSLRASIADDFTRISALLGKPIPNQSASINEIVTLVNNHHYQIACKRHYELSHPADEGVVAKSDELIITHPNQYFQESEKYWQERAKVPANVRSVNNNNNNNSMAVDSSSVIADVPMPDLDDDIDDK